MAALPDLASRLRAVPVAKLAAPDDALIGAVLVKLFADRQLAVDQDVIAYLLPRMERSLGNARAMVAQIDDVALAARRPVTRDLRRVAPAGLNCHLFVIIAQFTVILFS
jgi:chromosomal replication initiation ATPase DnaA